MHKKKSLASPHSDIIFYTSPDGAVHIEVFYQNETFWLTLNRMAELFGTTKQSVSYHLQNIFNDKELLKEATVKEILTVQSEGERKVSRNLEYYNLDAIIAVGYRINSLQATQFRIWATNTLREFIIKGFVLDDNRLKQGSKFGKDYFDELLERIREIRASERRFYLKITDIYEQCSIDYNKDAEITYTFFRTVQNKLHWAITGKTAAEIIAERADAEKPFMGLLSWKNSPHGKILKSDVTIAKNYLTEKEVKGLERVVTMFLDYAENKAARQIPMKMVDWVTKLDSFLRFNDYDILTNAGKIAHDVAKNLAEKEYDKFRIIQDKTFKSDFEKEVAKITDKKAEEKE
ncbi:MAG: virulence RhuM family protein [Chitinispirillaceae bacterium]|nr:virulence RhuM family protein [Chitinispirillaceae bacterium]